MSSLRTRVLASVLLLSAAGLLALATVTYTEQRSFLEGRVDQQVRQAGPVVSQALDNAEGNGSPDGGRGAGGVGNARGGPGGGPSLPPGTFGQRRTAGGQVKLKTFFSYGQATPAEPIIPSSLALEHLITVDSTGSSGLRYRVYASKDPDDSDITVVAIPLTEVKQTLSRLLLVEGLVIAGVLAALGISAFFVVRLGLRPLSRMEVTAGAIAAGDLSRRVSPATSRTEIGRLGLALNEMLDRLEQAFTARQVSEDRLRQFLADASHELRTPLASIRGYAELFRMGATAEGEETETAMRRIEEESKRMGVLVEDLLTLARLDEEPETIHHPVDLAQLAHDAVHDARATAPERTIGLTSPGAAIVSGDAHQLRQVLANLMRNALVHTPSGTPIEVSVADDGENVTLTVRDHGPGLPDGAHEKLFGRFWRSEGGRERGKAGAGLGLAIVQGVLDAHGAGIDARNAPGGGAEFVVRVPHIPAARPAELTTD
ncbi:MAG TPA: HAMP domain-containing sensor histidine kinase [Solirubrobacteraceae bacterium]|jgi:two-component system OmpR family sensor kinase